MCSPFPLQKSAIGNWKSAITSLVSKRFERVDPCRSARGDVTSEQRNEQQQQRDCYKREWILLTNTKQETSQQPYKRKRRCKPDHQSDANHSHSLPQDHLEHITNLRAQRDANTELMRALCH